MGNKQVKVGIILSYGTIILNMLVGVLLTPFLIRNLGAVEYGLYQLIASFSATLLILDFGIGSTATRYVALYSSKNDRRSVENATTLSLIIASVFALVIFGVSLLFFFLIPQIYQQQFTSQQLQKLQLLFMISSINIIVVVFEHVISGVISGLNLFAFTKSTAFFRIIFRTLLLIILVISGLDSVAIVLTDLFLTCCILLISLFFLIKKENVIPRLTFWDRSLLGDMFKYSTLSFLQSFATQFNGNVDKMILGRFTDAATIALYSVGLQIYSIYQQLPTAISSVMLPTVTKKINDGATNRQMEDLVIKVGRIQFLLLGATLAGFILFGKQFLLLWLDEYYVQIWGVIILLMSVSIIPTSQNVLLSVLRAKNKMHFRAYLLVFMVGFNFIVTYYGVQYYGFTGAAIGTAISLLMANTIGMNIYYKYVLGVDIKYLFKGILNGILPSLILSTMICYMIKDFGQQTWINFCLKVICFCVIYSVFLWKMGLNTSEKGLVTDGLKLRKIK